MQSSAKKDYDSNHVPGLTFIGFKFVKWHLSSLKKSSKRILNSWEFGVGSWELGVGSWEFGVWS